MNVKLFFERSFRLNKEGLYMMTSLPTSNKNLTNLTELHKSLASYLLTRAIGDQIRSIRELSDLFNASTGSLSAAVKDLENEGAITINRRGWLGSFLKKKSLGGLWRIIENGPMVIALTLPSFPKSEGLATAIYSLLERSGIETYLTFIRGSFNRLKTLRARRCHAIVISSLAADELCNQNEEILLKLPPQSFVTDHRIFYRNEKPSGDMPLRVGIDLDSFDIKYLTELEFAESNVEYIQMPFAQTDHYLERSPADAVISNLDHLASQKKGKILSRSLSPRVQALIGDRDTSAAIVIRAGANTTKIVLTEILNSKEIIEIQQQVVDGLIVPRY